MGCAFLSIALAAIAAYALYALQYLPTPWAWVAAISVITLVVFKYDKLRSQTARSGADRIPERALLLLALIGGTAGALLGMYVPPRHKTQKSSFKLRILLIVVVQIVALYFLWPRIHF